MEKIAHILYAEDNQNDIELTLAAFKECNLANPIDIVRDGEEALNYLFYRAQYVKRRKSNPIFILLDLKMPKLDGIEVIKIIRKTDEYKNLPVVMLTSSQMETDIVQSYEVGANAFVIKPVDFTEFIKVIKGIGYFWAIINTSASKI
jgi:CheY-like chemotaxis protein